MKWLLIILLLACSPERDIEVTEVRLKLVEIKNLDNYYGRKKVLTWQGDDNVRYFQVLRETYDTVGTIKILMLR